MSSKSTKLSTYKKKRDFKKTPEPPGRIKKSKTILPIFVIQKHDASHLHYDVRLEIDGTLPSWAVPKGPSPDPRVKRLAVRTEDHPLDYAKFEGVIPEGHYGAGPVMIWDNGTYENIKKTNNKLVPMKDCLHNGNIEIIFKGKKIKGAYALIRTKMEADKELWLLFKLKDTFADARKKPTTTQNKSVVSGRTIKEIEEDA